MIAILTDKSIGGTFLNWTLHYLRGDTTYYNASLDKDLELPADPLSESYNAHVFQANQPNTLVDFEKIFRRLQQQQNTCIYFHNFLGQGNSETAQAIELLDSHVTHKIVVTLPIDAILYWCSYKHRGTFVWSRSLDRSITDFDEAHKDFVNYYFLDSKKIWEQQQLINVWDKREFIALNFDPFDCSGMISECFDPCMPRYDITAIDLWTTFDQSVFDLFKHLDIEINKTRYQFWLPIYTKWKTIHRQRLMFAWYYKVIINNILHGVDYDLTRFNLDLCQEGAIQHALIYQHNLNFKTWQLEKFTNTQQLHQLLEPNIHDLSKSKIIGFDLASL